MLKVAQGDRSAFRLLFDRHVRSVTRFAYRFVGDHARAEELAQDIFIKLYRSAAGYQPKAKFKTYLFRVATNHCLNETRRGEYRVTRVADEHEDGAPVEPVGQAARPDEELAGRELERAVGTALGRLSKRERAAFSMCRFEGMAYRDIAEALSASEAAVKSLIHRATLSVARTLEELKQGALPRRSEA